MKKQMELLYLDHKPLLFSLAYRMLGSVMDAEDIVHEAIIAYGKNAQVTDVKNARAYLCRSVTNLCINHLRSASYKREAYKGQWLPEPVATEAMTDPDGSWLQKETLSTAYLLLLDQLTYAERAVFLLRDAFGYEYSEIAEILDKSGANCRKIYSRAKAKMTPNSEEGESVRTHIRTKESLTISHKRLSERFVEAMKNGNIRATLELLADHAVLIADGGGKVKTAPNPIAGSSNIAHFLYGIVANTDVLKSIQFTEINGTPGLIVNDPSRPTHVISFKYTTDKIEAIYVVANPDKLSHFIR